MAIDSGKMAAFVNEGAPPPDEEMPAEGEGEEMPEEGDVARFAKLIPLLEEFSEDVIDVSDEMDADMLLDTMTPLEEDDSQILQEGYGQLDRRLQKEMDMCCKGMTIEDATYVATHLADEGILDDPDRIAGWLYRVGELLGPGEMPEGEEGEEMPEEALEESAMADEDMA